jgi:hypothetical protein
MGAPLLAVRAAAAVLRPALLSEEAQNPTGPYPDLIGTLDSAAAPTANVYTTVHTGSGTYADLAILTNGQILLMRAQGAPAQTNSDYVSLDSITFQQ